MMTDDEILEVVQARRSGKQVQWLHLSSTGPDSPWIEVTKREAWRFDICRYRIKPKPPKPREWCCEVADVSGALINCHILSNGPLGAMHEGCIRVREVLE